MLPAKPICCLLTNSGRGAVAVVGMTGLVEELTGINDQLFEPVGSRSFQDLVDRTDQVIFYGQWRSTTEDLVVVKTSSGFEIHCHGGDAASAAIISDLNQAGCESVAREQWRLLCCDSWRAHTETAICAASTTRTANLLLRVLQNQLTALSKLSTQIQSQQSNEAAAAIKQMLDWEAFGASLTQPRSVVFCGEPNVGKSSLVNAVLGFQRAIVNSQAGTTRDVLSQSTAIDGWPVDLKDTAGLRASEDRIEALGIEKAKEEIARSQIRCLVLSCEDFGRVSNSDEVLATQRMLEQLDPQIVVFNKSDLMPDFQIPETWAFEGPTLIVSAADKAGLQALVASIGDVLVPKLPDEKQWFPVSSWHVNQLQLMLEQLNQHDFEAARLSLQPY